MLTLKILYRDGTEWVGDVRRVVEVGNATLTTDGVEPEDPRKRSDEAITAFAHRGPGTNGRWVGTVHVGTYEPNAHIKALLVESGSGREETYIVPVNDTYLLGADGQTVDRL